jgi:SAM-dependent methyltransferase
MDLGRLAVRRRTFDAYVSLGVVEHDPAGPARILAEAARVLAPGGRLILSVPYWNGVRKLGAPHLIRQGRRLRALGGEFYQFAYSRREVRGFLEAQGFRVLSFHPYDPVRMLRPALRWIARAARRGETRHGAAERGPGGELAVGARPRALADRLQRPRAPDARRHDPRRRRAPLSRYTDSL